MLRDPQVGEKDTKSICAYHLRLDTRICLLEVMDLYVGLLIVYSVL